MGTRKTVNGMKLEINLHIIIVEARRNGYKSELLDVSELATREPLFPDELRWQKTSNVMEWQKLYTDISNGMVIVRYEESIW